MNPRPKAAGKGRTRRPETVLDEADKALGALRTQAGWYATDLDFPRVERLLAELRRSLRDTRR